MKKLKIGIAGLNRGACAGTAVLARSEFVEITAICDIDKDVLKKRMDSFGAADAGQQEKSGVSYNRFTGQAFSSFEELIRCPDVDAVYLATPIPTHAELAVAAMKAGKHVLSEVICATDIADCERILKTIRETGRKYMMAENYCFIRPWSIVMNMVKAGLFGEVFYAEGNYLMDFTGRAGYPYIGGWRQNIYHMHQGHVYITHSLGPLTMLFNEPLSKVSCMGSGQYPRSWGLRADNTSTLNIRTQSGKLIHLRQDFLSPRPHDFLYYAFQGTKGAFEGSHSYHGAFQKDPVKMDQRVYIPGLCRPGEWRDLEDFADEFLPDWWKAIPEEIRDNGYDGGVPHLFDEFAKAVLEDRPVPIPPEVSLNWTAAGILSEKSSQLDGVPVDIPSFQ